MFHCSPSYGKMKFLNLRRGALVIQVDHAPVFLH